MQLSTTIPTAKAIPARLTTLMGRPNGQLKEQLLLPADAVSRNGAGYFVFKAQPTADGTIALPVKVEILFRLGTLVAVHSEMLEPGDPVITEGNERLFPMMPVTVLPEEIK